MSIKYNIYVVKTDIVMSEYQHVKTIRWYLECVPILGLLKQAVLT